MFFSFCFALNITIFIIFCVFIICVCVCVCVCVDREKELNATEKNHRCSYKKTIIKIINHCVFICIIFTKRNWSEVITIFFGCTQTMTACHCSSGAYFLLLIHFYVLFFKRQSTILFFF